MKIKDLKEGMYIRINSYYIRKIDEIRGKKLILDDYVTLKTIIEIKSKKLFKVRKEF